MELRRYAEILWRRQWVIGLTLIVTLAIVGLGIRLMTPVYSASAIVRIAYGGSGTVGYNDLNYSERLMSTYVYLLKSRLSMEDVNQRLTLGMSTEDLSDAVKVQALPNSELIKITAVDRDPRRAMEIANALGALLVEQEPRGYSMSVAEPAVAPTSPSQPRPALYLALGALLGLVGGLGLAFLFENLDLRIRSVDDLEAISQVPLIGSIPSFRVPNGSGGAPVLLVEARGSPAGDAFRLLGTSILSLASDERGGMPAVRTLLIASPDAHEATPMVTINLGAAMASAGYSIVVMDTELNSDRLHRLLASSGDLKPAGPSSLQERMGVALRETRVPGLMVLSASPSGSRTAVQLNLSGTRELIEELGGRADVVLLHGGSVLSSPEALGLAPMADGVLLVATRDRTTRRELELALRHLERLGGRTLGMILSMAGSDRGSQRLTRWPTVPAATPDGQKRVAV